MTESLTFFDRLLMKLALAKAIARGHFFVGLAEEVENAFRRVNRAADTSR